MNLPSTSAEVLAQTASHWKHCEGMEESTLLRLAILRDLVRSFHAEKSRCLATGQKMDAQSLKAWETRIDELRGSSTLEGDLIELLSDPTKKPKTRTRLLPEALFSALSREKLERFDRMWESALAAEAAQIGWHFWILDAWVDISAIEEWNQKLTEKLWPHGIVLFVEAPGASKPGSRPFEVHTEGAVSLWHGHWHVILHPRFKSPEELMGNVATWLGAEIKPPTPPRWKLLFSPRRR